MVLKVIILSIFLLGLTYLLLPGPKSINDIPPLPESLKSKEPGDTTQTPNIAAYFADLRRKEVIEYYKLKFSYLSFFGFKIPPIRLNHPPEEAYNYIRDQQASTYLEQFSYPLRDSIYINGYEPFDEKGKIYKRGATTIYIEGNYYDSKTTLRYYGSAIFMRAILYIGIWISGYYLYKLSKKLYLQK